jgi:putative heme-binding domain-containing protein
VDEKTARVLMDQLRTLKGEISADWVRSHLSKLPGAEKLLAELDADAAQQREQLETLLQALEPGDVRRGQAVFHSAKAACVACHAVGYVGGKIGPDLTRIGTIRTRRDLLEAIVYPSASFVRSYKPVQATTKRGQVYQGNLKSEDTTHVVLALSATEEIRLARRDLESLVPGKVSLMPAGLEKQLTRRELADLLAFLQACR